MELLRNYKQLIVFNIIIFITFCFIINSFSNFTNLNLIFYIFFHLTFIYTLFYYYHFTIYIIAFIYGIFLDIFLMNNIGIHLVSLLIIILIYNLLKKYLYQLSSNQISISILILLIFILSVELLIAKFFFNIKFDNYYFLKIQLLSVIIFIPSIFIFNKLDK